MYRLLPVYPPGSVSFLSLSCLLALATTSTRHPFYCIRFTESPTSLFLVLSRISLPVDSVSLLLGSSLVTTLTPQRRTARTRHETHILRSFYIYSSTPSSSSSSNPTNLCSHSGLSTPTVPYTSPAHSTPAGAAFLTKIFDLSRCDLTRSVFFLTHIHPATTTLNQVVHLSPGTYSQPFVTSVQHTLFRSSSPPLPPSLAYPPTHQPPSHALAWTNTLLLSTTNPT